MSVLNAHIEKFYDCPNLYNDIRNRLKERNIDLNNVTRKEIARFDEFHVRGAEISKELAEIANINKAKLLDIGSGIGGPCRMLANEFNCNTIGIDLSKEYVDTANRLSELVGLNHKTTFIQGDATNLPFQDNSFDIVWTQQVQMNISDKLKFYSEIDRVLHHKGAFIYYEIFKKGKEEVNYPMPWANEYKISFLEQSSKMNTILEQLGLIKEQSKDQTESGIKVLEKSLHKIESDSSVLTRINLLMGTNTKEKITNLLHGLKEGNIHLESGVYRKNNKIVN